MAHCAPAPAVLPPSPGSGTSSIQEPVFLVTLASALDVFILEYLGVFQVSLYY